MTVCLLVGAALQCITSTAPPLSPEAAVRTLLPGQFVPRERPVVDISPRVPQGTPQGTPQDGPFGPLSLQRLQEPRRLDGSSFNDPQWVMRAWVGEKGRRR